MRAALTIARKDLRVLAGRPIDAFFIFAFPVLYAAFFTQVVSGSARGLSRIQVAVVDRDGSPDAEAFVAKLEQLEGFLVRRLDDAAQAQERVRRGELAAYVVLEGGFAEGETPRLTLGRDPVRQGEAGFLEGALGRLAGARFEARLRAQLAPWLQLAANPLAPGPSAEAPALDLRPLVLEREDVRGESTEAPSPASVTLPQGMAWGLLACAAAFGTSLAGERSRGTLARLRTAPIPRSAVLLGKGLACFVTILAVNGLLLALAVPAFGLHPQSWGLLGLAVLSAATCFVGVMMLVAVLGRTEDEAFRLGWGLLLVLAMIGGAMVPAFLMPEWMTTVAKLSPVRWTILALEGAIWRGFDLQDMLWPCAALLGQGALAFAVGAWVNER